MSDPLTEEQREQISKALQQVSAEYYKSAIELLTYLGHGELNYVRTPIHMPNGSEYLLALLHVSGPVLDLHKIGEYEASIERIKITSKE